MHAAREYVEQVHGRAHDELLLAVAARIRATRDHIVLEDLEQQANEPIGHEEHVVGQIEATQDEHTVAPHRALVHVLLEADEDGLDQAPQVERRQLAVVLLPVLEHVEERRRAADLNARVVRVSLHHAHDQVAAEQRVADELVPVQLEQVVERVDQERLPVVHVRLHCRELNTHTHTITCIHSYTLKMFLCPFLTKKTRVAYQIGLSVLAGNAPSGYVWPRGHGVFAAEAAEKVEHARLVAQEHESADATLDHLGAIVVQGRWRWRWRRDAIGEVLVESGRNVGDLVGLLEEHRAAEIGARDVERDERAQVEDDLGERERRIRVRVHLQLVATIGRVQVAQAPQSQQELEVGAYVVGEQVGDEQMRQTGRQIEQAVEHADGCLCRCCRQCVERSICCGCCCCCCCCCWCWRGNLDIPLVGAAVGQVEVLEAARCGGGELLEQRVEHVRLNDVGAEITQRQVLQAAQLDGLDDICQRIRRAMTMQAAEC